MTQKGFYIDTTRCAGCRTCSVACADLNNTPVGLNLRRVVEYEGGEWKKNWDGTWRQNVFAYYVSMGCNECADPACVKVNANDETDIYLNVSWVLKSYDGLLPAGHEVAADQIALHEAPVSAFAAGSRSVPGNHMPEFFESADDFTFSGNFVYGMDMPCGRISEWSAVIDKRTGALTRYVIDGKQVLKEPLMPSFGRAPVENDLGADLHDVFEMWRYPEFRLSSVKADVEDGYYRVVAEYAPYGKVYSLTMTYSIYPDGSVKVAEKMHDAGELKDAPYLFRFGMKLAMPGGFSTFDFYGRGPWDNYCDRKSSAQMGHYVQRVQDQYWYGYVRTQESGTKSDMRWMRLIDNAGKGIEISSDVRFSGSALPFSQRDMDSALENPFPRTGRKYALVFGNEVDGVQQEVVDASDGVLEIPQYGTKHSLNISVSAGIVLWHIASALHSEA